MLSLDEQGQPHCAPMGPVVDERLEDWLLRPFQTSTTFKNLQRHDHCIFHVTDNALLVTQLVLGKKPVLEFSPLEDSDSDAKGWILKSACHWYQLRIDHWDTSQPRSEARARIVNQGQLRPFWGWNRAKHAVLEAAILSTRFHLLDREYVIAEFEGLQSAITKTAGQDEKLAWEMLQENLAKYDWESKAESR